MTAEGEGSGSRVWRLTTLVLDHHCQRHGKFHPAVAWRLSTSAVTIMRCACCTPNYCLGAERSVTMAPAW